MKKVSIIIPVYNQEYLLINCLKSIPIRKDLEIIIINDASTDGTKDKLENYIIETDRDLIIINSETNDGCAMSLNKGIDRSTGEYILQVDSDDYLITQNFIDLLDQINDSHEDIIFFDNITNDGTILSQFKTIGVCDHICLYKKDLIGETRYENKRCAAGWNFHQTILSKEHSERYIEKIIYHYNFPREGSNFDLMKKGLLRP